MNKIYLIAFSLVSAINSYASDSTCSTKVGEKQLVDVRDINTDVPKFLRGAKIIVRQADGKESIVPAEKFKVVPRKQQFIVTETQVNTVTECKTDESNKNRLSVLGGYGAKSGIGNSERTGDTVEVESKVGFSGGLQYQRLLTNKISAGIQGQTNKTTSVMLGLDF